MQTVDRTQNPSGKEATEPPLPGLVVALQGLYRAFQKHAMYPSGHPSVPQAIALAREHFRAALAERSPIVVGVARDQLLVGDMRIGEASEPVRALALLLHGLDVAALEFRTGLSEADLVAVVDELARARREHRPGAELVHAVAARQVTNLRLCPVDYRALSFGEGVQRDSEGPADMWQHLSRVLTDPSTYETSSPVDEVAVEVAERIAELEGAGVGGLRTELHRQVEDMGRASGDHRLVLRRRMASFVNALNPELRRNLLQVGPGKPRESLAIMAELADALPAKDLLEALQNVDRVAGQAHEELLVLLNKLNRISCNRPVVALQLEDTLDRWGVSAESLEEPVKLRQALEEVFRRRDDTVYNPADYHSMLDRLSKEELKHVEEAAASRALYRYPTDEDVQRHAAEVAVLLLARSDGDDQRPELFAYVGANAGLMLGHRDFGALKDAAVAARADRTLKAEQESIRLAADGFLSEFQSEERVDRVVRAALGGHAVPDEALVLLELGGATALDHMLEAMAERLEPEAGDAFRNCALRMGAEVWGEAVGRRAARGWRALKPMFPLVRMMDPSVAVPLVKKLMGHPDSRVRREALLALCKVDGRTPQERYLALALGDRSLRVVATAIRQLAALGTPESLELLGAFLAGNLSGALLTPETCRLALELLSEHGTVGVRLLSESLESMSRGVSPRKVRMARILAEYLLQLPPEEAVSHALARWRRSPARILARFLPVEPIVARSTRGGDA